jgi:alanyl-tRNA synthetase
MSRIGQVLEQGMGKVKAGGLVKFVAQQVAAGGGKPDMAMAGGTDASKLPGLQSVQGWMAERV